MKEIKIRYTWKRKPDGHIWQPVLSIEDIEKEKRTLPPEDSSWEIIARDLWTGWQDKNKNDIFCNDLISEGGGETLYQVIWQSHAGEWIMQSLAEGRGYRNMAYDYAQLDYEIKGNIHQPPTTTTK